MDVALIINDIIKWINSNYPNHRSTYQVESSEKLKTSASILLNINKFKYLLLDCHWSEQIIMPNGHTSITSSITIYRAIPKKYKHLEILPKCIAQCREGRIVTYEQKEMSLVEFFSVIIPPIGEKRLKEKRTISKTLSQFIGFSVPEDVIEYDINTESYYLSDWQEAYGVEQTYFREKWPAQEKSLSYIAKYTSLSTLFTILNSKTIRMNSVIGMNDKSEKDFFSYCWGGEDNDSPQIVYDASKNFITSFSTLIDDLTMWRLYGNDAKGVCLVFKYKEMKNLKPVIYIDKHKDNILSPFINTISKLEEENIKITFNTLRRYKRFMKPISYKPENEYRLLKKTEQISGRSFIKDIITPYIDCNLNKNEREKAIFPLDLEKIIIGPNMPQKEINKIQLYNLLSENSLFIDIEDSNIETYQ
jgi:Protein of unknown function (DUF2971).